MKARFEMKYAEWLSFILNTVKLNTVRNFYLNFPKHVKSYIQQQFRKIRIVF